MTGSGRAARRRGERRGPRGAGRHVVHYEAPRRQRLAPVAAGGGLLLSVDGGVQQERNIQHLGFQQYCGRCLDLQQGTHSLTAALRTCIIIKEMVD